MKYLKKVKHIYLLFFICFLCPRNVLYANNKDKLPLNTTKTLLSDIENAKRIAWICPHCDDEMFMPGFIALATYRYKKDVYVITGPLPKGALREPRRRDNLECKVLLGLQDYIRQDDFEYRKNGVQAKPFMEFVSETLIEKNIDLVITLDPVQGYNGQPQHIKVSKMVTNLLKDIVAHNHGKRLKLYYLINPDPGIIGCSKNISDEIQPYTDVINMDREKVTLFDGSLINLWEVRKRLLHTYGDSIPGLIKGQTALSSNALKHIELYQKVNLREE